MPSRSAGEVSLASAAPTQDAGSPHDAAPQDSPERRGPRERPRRALLATVALGVLVALLVVLVAVLGMRGYRAYVMQTPSMGTSAPVGSLVVTQPVQVEQVHRGDVVTVAPRAGGSTHTHRVTEVSGDRLTTQGDLNGSPDPEAVDATNLVGRAVCILPVVGWVVKMLPIVLVSVLLGGFLTHRIKDRHSRFRYRTLGFFCGLALAMVLVKPLLGVQLLAMQLDEGRDGPFAVAHVVSTGLFPVRVTPAQDHGSASALLAPTGTPGEAVATQATEHGEFAFYPHLELTPLWWLGVVLYCASPFLILGLHALITRAPREVSA